MWRWCVDAIDGPLARAANVAEVWPSWSGDTLDLVVDYTTYVFVPAYAVAAGGLMPDALALPAAAAIAITGTLYFANREMKTPDNFFRGFPAVWNLVVFYLLLLRPTPVMAAATIALVRRPDIRADPFRPSVPGAAAAHGDRGAADAVGCAGARGRQTRACARAVDFRGIMPDCRLFRAGRAVAGAQRS